MNQEQLKQAVAREAVAREVRSGMRVGLGTGSTAAHALDALGAALREERLHDIVGVPTSEATARQARSLGIPLAELHEVQTLDLTIDGADEIDPALNLIKGLGGALLREKMVAQATTGRYVVIGDDSKRVRHLGERAPLPVEVVRFGWRYQAARLAQLGAEATRREQEGEPFVTDNGNYILDCRFGGAIPDPQTLEWLLHAMAGVVEHGLFLEVANVAYVATPGRVLRLDPQAPADHEEPL